MTQQRRHLTRMIAVFLMSLLILGPGAWATSGTACGTDKSDTHSCPVPSERQQPCLRLLDRYQGLPSAAELAPETEDKPTSGSGLELTFLTSAQVGSQVPDSAPGLHLASPGSQSEPTMGTRTPMGPTSVFTVCQDGSCDYTRIQDAVDAATEGDVIKVAEGTYSDVHIRPRADITTTGVVSQVVYLSKTVTIRGGYSTSFSEPPDPEAYPTLLDAHAKGRALYITGPISPTVEGLHITGGTAYHLGGGQWDYDSGGGIYVFAAAATLRDNYVFNNATANGAGICLRNSSATVAGNTIVSNTVSGEAGALLVLNSDAAIIGNTISSNVAGVVGAGLALSEGSTTLIEGNIVTNNISDFGAVWLHSSDATLVGNIITGNTARYVGGGVGVENSSPSLTGNIIAHNTAQQKWGGGLYLWKSDALLVNNVIADNHCDVEGSGLHIRYSSPRLLHNTIARNTGSDGIGIYVTGGYTAALTNTILVGHDVGIFVTADSTAILEATLWGSGSWANGMDWSGEGTVIVRPPNIWDNAAFRDPDDGDYHITSNSQAMDTGLNAGVGFDLDGDPRPMGQQYDIGADEYNSAQQAGADLAIIKRALPEPVLAGDELVYTLSYTNTGPDLAANVVVTDALPYGVTLVDAQPYPDVTHDVLVWNIGSLPAAGSGDIVVTVTVNPDLPSDAVLTNFAAIATSVQDPEPSDNGCEVTTTVKRRAGPVYLPLLFRNFRIWDPYYEENDHWLSAYGPIASGQTYQAYPDDTDDYYYFQLSSAATVNIRTASFAPTSTYGDLLLYGPATGDNRGPLIAQFGSPGHSSMVLPPQSLGSGKYYIRVYVSDSSYFADDQLYTLTLSH